MRNETPITPDNLETESVTAKKLTGLIRVSTELMKTGRSLFSRLIRKVIRAVNA
jgi:hypothetical protein